MQRAEKPVAEFGNVIAAFGIEHVARLTGLTVARLRNWDRDDFFKPSMAEENRRASFSRVYSFKDLASLRVLAVLLNKHNVSVRHLKQVSKKLEHLSEDRWLKTTLYVLKPKRKVVFVEPETERPREVVSGQFTLALPLEKVVAETRADVAKMNERPFYHRGKIEQNRLVAHNLPVIAGTRIPVRAIKSFAEAGYSEAQIIDEYPDLTPEDVQAAIAYRESRKAA